MPLSKHDDRAERAIAQAQEAFWSALARCYPEVTTGDLDPTTSFQFEETSAAAAREWIELNGVDIVFTHDQLARLAGVAGAAAMGQYGTPERGTVHAINARQGEPRDARFFGPTMREPEAQVNIDSRDMVISVDWLSQHQDRARTWILVRRDGASIAQDQP